MKAVLSPTQLHRLKEHRYQVEGTPFLEFYIRFFWTWLVEYIPLWVAPNLLTLAGLTINFLMGLLVVIQDPNAAGKVRCTTSTLVYDAVYTRLVGFRTWGLLWGFCCTRHWMVSMASKLAEPTLAALLENFLTMVVMLSPHL